MESVTITRVVRGTDELRALLVELDDELAANYLPEQRHGLDFEAIFEPHIRFFTAHRGGIAVGCGGVALFAGFAEIKRMYVREVARGSGAAQALLAHLEAEARRSGISLIRLETGSRQLAAIRLYERFGFRPCSAFGDYVSMPPSSIETSLFFEKFCGRPSPDGG